MSKTIEISRQQLEYWRTMLQHGLPETVASMIETVIAAPVVERQADLYRVLTPKTTIDGEVTEWWPGCILYTEKQLSSIVGPYKIEQRYYSSPPELVAVLLPERKPNPMREAFEDTDIGWEEWTEACLKADEWNACLDKVKELNQ